MQLVLYHYPKCSKSRAALEYLQQNNFAVQLVDYRKTPLSLPQLQTLAGKLGLDSPLAMMRSGDDLFVALGLPQADDETLFTALVQHPELLQRPIVEIGERAVIGRPIQQLQQFLREAA